MVDFLELAAAAAFHTLDIVSLRLIPFMFAASATVGGVCDNLSQYIKGGLLTSTWTDEVMSDFLGRKIRVYSSLN